MNASDLRVSRPSALCFPRNVNLCGGGEAVLDAAARGVGAGVGSSRDDQDEEQEYCAVNSGKAPFPFSNCKIILGREFSKGFGIHRGLSLKENEPINSCNVVVARECVKYLTHS